MRTNCRVVHGALKQLPSPLAEYFRLLLTTLPYLADSTRSY